MKHYGFMLLSNSSLTFSLDILNVIIIAVAMQLDSYVALSWGTEFSKSQKVPQTPVHQASHLGGQLWQGGD